MFNPNLRSVVLAHNLANTKADMEEIAKYYTGVTTHLHGTWNNVQEMVYQLDIDHIDWESMLDSLRETSQDALMIIAEDGVYMRYRESSFEELVYIGNMFEVETPSFKQDYIYCSRTNTHWEVK